MTIPTPRTFEINNQSINQSINQSTESEAVSLFNPTTLTDFDLKVCFQIVSMKGLLGDDHSCKQMFKCFISLIINPVTLY